MRSGRSVPGGPRLAAGADGYAGGLVDPEAPGRLGLPAGEHFALPGPVQVVEHDGAPGHEPWLEERERRGAAVSRKAPELPWRMAVVSAAVRYASVGGITLYEASRR
jgi:hypothetical protein